MKSSNEIHGPLIRIGIFYDGQYFFNVSNYYKHEHRRRARISLHGLHEFIRQQAATHTGVDARMCQIVDAHYFRGRMSAHEAEGRQKLYDERVFDDILMGENVVSHYMPLRYGQAGEPQEKGIDVWLALEAYEMAIYKRFDVVALIACDGDYVPLARKLNTLGTRTMLVSWDFEYIDKYTQLKRVTRTSQQLLEEVNYPVAMHQLIDDRVQGNSPLVSNLFVAQPQAFAENPSRSASQPSPQPARSPSDPFSAEAPEEAQESTILNLKDGYGFIEDRANNNVFFHYSSLENADFNELYKGMRVRYTTMVGTNGKLQVVKMWVLQGQQP